MDCLADCKVSGKGLDEEEIYVSADKYILSQLLELRTHNRICSTSAKSHDQSIYVYMCGFKIG